MTPRLPRARSEPHGSRPGESSSAARLLLLGCLLVVPLCACRARPQGDWYGAYRQEDGHVLIIGQSTEKNTLRLIDAADGLSRRLYPVAHAVPSARAARYQTGEGWSVKEPATLFVQFERAAGREPTVRLESAGRPPLRATRVPNATEELEFDSEGVRLSGTLYLPEGPGPHPAIVLHQGSERDSWQDHNLMGYLFASHGVAAFCYDKRGVGRSQGTFTMDFHRLATDMVAAVERLKRHEAIAADRIGVGGYSQGGWIGPLAASRSGDIRFVHVGFGLADTPFDEDREQTLNGLRDRGYGDADLDKARQLVAVVHGVIRRNLDGGWEELDALKKQYHGEPWMKHLDDGMAGAFVQWPGWCLRTIGRKQVMLHGLTWDYDPRPTLQQVDVPMLWLLGSEDREAPNRETIARLGAFKKRGKPFDVVVLPGADHGGVVFRVNDGRRVITGFHPDYMRTQAEWVARAAGLGAEAATAADAMR